jgi:hypothetical protein
MKEADKGYKSVDMFQIGKRLLLQWKLEKQLNGTAHYCHDFRSGTSLLLPLCTIFEIH